MERWITLPRTKLRFFERQNKTGAFTQLGINVNACAVGLKDIPGRRQPQPKSIGFGGKVGFEDPRNIFFGDAAAIVIDIDAVKPGFLSDRDIDDARLGGYSFHRIDEDVEQGDLEFFAIGHDESRLLGIGQFKPDIFQ